MDMFEEAYYQNDDAAREYLESVLWPEGPVCPHCGCTGNTTRMNVKRQSGVYQCNDCRKPFTVTINTVMEGSHVPLHKWLQALYLLCASKKGMSAHQMHRMLGVTYKTAWFMAHRIREAMSNDRMILPPMGGTGHTVEVDETYCGTIPGATMTRGGHHKNKVVSLVERGDEARSFHVQRVNGATLKPMLAEHIAEGTRIMTDEAYWYKWLPKGSHFTVNHLAGDYGHGNVTTNTVEGFFATFKRGLNGTYHHISNDRLDAYLSEFDFRYNTRTLTDTERTVEAVKGMSGKRLFYYN